MEAVVETSHGKLAGQRITAPGQAPLTVFRGIPYAAPPVGTLRFRSPRPAEPWAGLRDASIPAPSPVQSKSSLYASGIPGNQVSHVSEDCLTVDVWAPDGQNLPVMVWVCGGAYLTGGSAIETYDGSRLAASQGVVVVSVNYRLGALGFAAIPGGDTNCGLRDQLAALRWVADHAATFGGDPANITVFGESAGAGSVLHLLSSPMSAGAVRRAILQSPGVEHTLTDDLAYQVTSALLRELELDKGQEARAWDLPWQSILDAQERALLPLMVSIGSMPFHPVVDGDFLPAKPGVAFRAPHTDLLVSWTADEMRLYPNTRMNEGGPARLSKAVTTMIANRIGHDPEPTRVQALIDFYESRGAATDRAAGADIWAAIQTDGLMRLPARRVALSHAASAEVERGTFTAQFDWQARGGEWERGAFHAIDLPFTFSTLDRGGWMEFLGATDDGAAQALAHRHMDAWGRFARSGNPGWDVGTYSFDSEDRILEDPLGDAAAAWDGLWSADGRPPA